MILTEELKKELAMPPKGTKAPYYFRYLGYKKDLTASPAMARANAAYELFCGTEPEIYVHDLIAGNDRPLWCQADQVSLGYAKRVDESFGNRNFCTNCDHYAPNYSHVVSVGIRGMIGEIESSMERHQGDSRRMETLKSMKVTLEGFLGMIRNYRDVAVGKKRDSAYDSQRLDFIIENCEALLAGPPGSFAQALQLVWFCHTAFLLEGRYAMALGRIDQYLFPFYQKDLETGKLTEEEAIRLLENAFAKIDPNDVVNICIGGMDIHGHCQVNGLSHCVLRAVCGCKAPGPNLSARITWNTPEDFLDECLRTIGTGIGYPALMNDAINIAALKKYGYEEEDVYNYCMVGCVENFIAGMQPPWSDGRFDPPRFFDYVFHRGISEFSHSLGLDMGDVEEIRSMEEFMERYEAQLRYGAKEYWAFFRNMNDSVNQKHYPQPFLSCFCHDCIGRGLDINDGGSKYPSVHGVCLMGVGTVADSLAAVEKVVFMDKAASLTELKDALKCNFKGYEELRELLLAAPKYGNNDDFVDKYAVWFVDFLSGLFGSLKTRDGGGIYVAMAANTNNIWAGQQIAATPDGREQGEPLSDAASPTYGRDVHGPTMTINSLTKPDYTKVACASVVNQKFMPGMFGDGKRERMLALIKTYFKKGGQEMQINAIAPETLRDAMAHPDNYQDLVVRVSGYSAYYITLDRSVQLDILNRTQHG